MGRSHGRALVALAAFAGLTVGCGGARSAPAESAALSPQHQTGSVAVIDGDELRDVPEPQIEGLLEGRVAGVEVIRHADRGMSIRIRGAASFMGGTEPLYVVDGVPVQAEPGRGLYWLNPSDVERIEILKDASATALYGVRGANGVVVITTRRPGRQSGEERR